MKKFISILVIFLYHTLLFSQSTTIKEELNKSFALLESGFEDSAKIIINQIIRNKTDSEKDKAVLYYSVGNKSRLNRYFEFALHFLEHAKEQTIFINDSIFLGDILNEIGLLYYDQEKNVEGLEALVNALEIAYALNDTLGSVIAQINIGNIFKDTRDYETALIYYNKVLNRCAKNEMGEFKAMALINIGSVLLLQEKSRDALIVLNKSEPIVIKHLDTLNLAHVKVNSGICHLYLNEFSEAQIALKNALTYYRSVKSIEGEYLALVNLYIVSSRIKNEAQKNHYRILTSDSKYRNCNRHIQADFLQGLHDDRIALGDTINAYIFGEQLKILNDQLLVESHNKALNQLKTEVNFVQVKNELETAEKVLLKEQNEKEVMQVLNRRLEQQKMWILSLSIIIILLLLFFIISLWKANKKTQKSNYILAEQKAIVEAKQEEILNSTDYAETMEKLLLQQMNPHFLHNALTTIDASLATDDIQFAQNYLNLFSDLLRKTLDNSRLDAISLEQEIGFLKSYVELNAIRQGEHFKFEFIYDKEEVEDFVYTPPMLLQPFVENALIHGLYHKVEGEKKLTIEIKPYHNHIVWVVADNGVGRVKAQEIGKTHKGISHGINITKDRIYWLKKRYRNDFSIEYYDLEQGTKVVIKTPVVDLER
ncbi:MAG: histidine kinase [Crocinitomicaceae bacterium]